ncbi:MAG: stage V sporulation protein AC [Clostridia bacterium]|nr:stage V sporulation protein AC [Oscillospiraceae bacterium]MBQ7960523.1 stage V sporulation protein AC [Clostridia bacterium]
MDYDKKDYKNFIEKKSPNSKLWRNMLSSFVVGGLICTLGQGVGNIYKNFFGLDEADVRIAVPITMIFLGALFTGLDLYNKLAKYAGAGTLVPITGFSNAVVSPAIEFRREGFILGLAAKMFVIAGPVIVYGINASVIMGLVMYLFGLVK